MTASTDATYSKHERIQHRQISKLATNLNILRASFKAEFQASQLSDQNDICQSLIFSGHMDNKLKTGTLPGRRLKSKPTVESIPLLC